MRPSATQLGSAARGSCRFQLRNRLDFGTCFVTALIISVQLSGQEIAANAPQSDVQRIGDADVRSVVTGFITGPKQPAVYWHDREWRIDLMNRTSDDEPDAVSLQASTGEKTTVELPDYFEQINSILRAPGDKAIVVEVDHRASSSFAIIDLRAKKVIDLVGAGTTVKVSPNRRFILFDNWYPNEAATYENLYRLYDTLKSPRQNVCGWPENDPNHENPESAERGFQIYPLPARRNLCLREDLSDDNLGSDFAWAPDSSKVVFADVKAGVMSLVLVTPPAGPGDPPRTSIHGLVGPENICKGAFDAAGEPMCDYHVIRSLSWEGDSIRLDPAPVHVGSSLIRELIVPVSKFVPIQK